MSNHTSPQNLEKYAFLWSEARLVIAAVALFLGGVPPLFKLGLPYSLTRFLLTLAWIISGVASVYLLYRWQQNQKNLFGRKNQHDSLAFFVSIVSGINLGLVPILNKNIGMSVSSNKLVFILVGLIYLVSAGYLFDRWKKFGRKLF